MSVSGRLSAVDIARRELGGFVATAESAGIDRERLHRLTRLSPQDWQRWLGILRDEPPPPRPALPLVLRHLGYLNSRLDRLAEARYG